MQEFEKTVHALRTVMDASPVGILVFNPDEYITYANAAAEKLFGKTLTQPDRVRCGDFISCANRSLDDSGCGFTPACPGCPLFRALRAALAGEQDPAVTEGETLIEREPGFGPIWLKFKSNSLLLDGGRSAVMSLDDITERKQAEDALRHSREYYRTTLNSIGDAVIATDIEGNIEHMNPVAEKLTGWTEKEALGNPLKKVFRIIRRGNHRVADKPMTIENPAARVLREARVLELPDDVLLINRNGREIPIADSSAPIKKENGKPTGVVLVFRDQAEERWAQRLTETRLDLIEYAIGHTMDEVLTRALDLVGHFVDSPIGFYHFLDADQKTLTLQQWSTRTLKDFCRAGGKGTHYSVDQAGVWVDCVRERRPVIHNDYLSLPHRKGMPAGHPKVIRELVAPVMRGEKIVALLGVGNKPVNYTREDMKTVAYLADVTWHIVEQKRSEEKIARVARDWDATFDAIGDAICLLDGDGKILRYNHAFELFVGKKGEEIIGRRCYEVIHQASTFIPGCPFLRARESGKRVDVETPLGAKWLRIKVDPVFDENGKLCNFVHVMVDITARKLTQERLLSQNAITEAINDILENTLRCNTTEEVALNCLAVAEKLTGSDFGWLGELNPSGRLDTLALSGPGWKACPIYGAKNPRMIQNMEIGGIWGRLFRDGESLFTNDPRMDSDWAGLPDGHPEIKSFLGVPLKRSGQTIGIIALANKPSGYTPEDRKAVEMVSAALVEALMRKRAEEVLQRSEELLRETQAISKMGGWEYDVEKKRITWTDEVYRIYGVEKSYDPNNIQQNIAFYAEGEQNKLERAFTHAVATGTPYDLELSFNTAKGEPKWVRTVGNPVVEGGRVVRVVGNIMDITERRRAEEKHEQLQAQFVQAQKLESVGRLAGGVAHDFNNLLSVIMGYGEMIRGDTDENHPHHEPLEEIHKAALRARDLTRQLLAFSRKQVLELRPVDLNAIVAGFEKMLRRMIGEDISLEIALSPAPLIVQADTAHMEQVLMNLAVNARDAMPDGGTLVIETAVVDLDEAYAEQKPGVTPGRYAMIGVSDTGCGMDKDTLGHIFEPFFTTKATGKGTGLGLATCYGIVKQHRGNIWVYSEPGKGAAFKIYLPLSFEEAKPTTAPSDAHEPDTGFSTVLIVEDEASVRRLAARMLAGKGYTVLTAESAKEAVDLARRHEDPLHLVLTDVVLPGMKGPELFALIREHHPNAKALYMSGYTDNAIAHHGVLEKGIAFLQKPFTLDGLARKVREVLQGA